MTESPNKHKRNESTPIKDSIKDRSINNKKDESIFEVHDEREKSINVGRDGNYVNSSNLSGSIVEYDNNIDENPVVEEEAVEIKPMQDKKTHNVTVDLKNKSAKISRKNSDIQKMGYNPTQYGDQIEFRDDVVAVVVENTKTEVNKSSVSIKLTSDNAVQKNVEAVRLPTQQEVEMVELNPTNPNLRIMNEKEEEQVRIIIKPPEESQKKLSLSGKVSPGSRSPRNEKILNDEEVLGEMILDVDRAVSVDADEFDKMDNDKLNDPESFKILLDEVEAQHPKTKAKDGSLVPYQIFTKLS